MDPCSTSSSSSSSVEKLKKEEKDSMASFKSVSLLLLVILAGGILLAAGDTTGPARDKDNDGTLLTTVITNNDTFEMEMVCLYKHWLKHHGERTDYTLVEFELDPRFLLFKSYFEPLPIVPTLESRCLSQKDNSIVADPPKNSDNGHDDDHDNNSTVTYPPKDNVHGHGDQHNDDNDDEVDHHDANAINNCDNHSDQQPKKEKGLRDKVLNVLPVAMTIVGIITTAVLVALVLSIGFIKFWAFLRMSCERGDGRIMSA